MKKNFLFGFAVTVLIASCSQKPTTDAQTGVYKMDKSVIKSDTSETVYLASDGNTQFKIYTPTEYFFIALSKDSSAGFGLGSYSTKDGTILESNIFNTNTLDSTQNVSLTISKTEKGYTQTIPEMVVGGQKLNLVEEYTTIIAHGESALDGVWQQTKNLVVNGKDTSDQTYNEYKVFQSGHFMWGAKYLADSVAKSYKTIVGHGTFTLNNDALTENLDMSSMPGITGKYNIIVKFNGADEYTQQTADTSTHIVGFKTYKRIRK